MKKKRLLMAFLGLTLALGLASCGEGKQGEKGEPGSNGSDGKDGVSVVSVEKTAEDGLVATYTITLSNGTTKTFTVKNGENGQNAVQYYPVTFRNENGNFLDASFVEEGKALTYDFTPESSEYYTYEFTGWDKEANNITEPTTLTATYNHKKIFMGSYPQTEVKDESLVAKLSGLAGKLPDPENLHNWIEYDYDVYLFSQTYDKYMFFQDIDLDSDGQYDFRGVHMLKYRPYGFDNIPQTSSDRTYQKYNGYEINNTYWFKYEPIEWNVLDTKSGNALIVANKILDSQEFFNVKSSDEVDHSGVMCYSNNYEYSNIRKYLNDNLFKTASLSDNTVLNNEVDNSIASSIATTNSYLCNNVEDNLFLLSSVEAKNYFEKDEDRLAIGTDYAKAQGLFYKTNTLDNIYSSYILRTPNPNTPYFIYSVTYSGNVSENNLCSSTAAGIRPACWIKL